MTPVFGLCDDYVTRWAALDPVAAGMQGLSGVFGAATDYSPDGYAARAELMAVTLAALAPMSVTSAADRLAAGFLRERLEAQLAWHQLNEPLRLVRAPIGLISAVRDSVDLLPRDGDDGVAEHRGAPGRDPGHVRRLAGQPGHRASPGPDRGAQASGAGRGGRRSLRGKP